MENNVFKTVTFGGFDKQDVIQYIEKTAQETAEQQQELQSELDALRAERDTLQTELASVREQVSALEKQVQEQTVAMERLQLERDTAIGTESELEQARAQIQTLTAQLAGDQSDAESYRQFRNQVGDIECQARRRAAELEAQTRQRLREAAMAFQVRYRELSALFDTAATKANGELRRLSSSIAQLPHSLDQVGAELKELDQLLAPDKPDKPAGTPSGKK